VALAGEVVTVFRGHALVTPGASVVFFLWVCRRGDEPTGPAFVHFDKLAAATHIEAYFYGAPPACQVAAYEFVLLNGASETPAMSASDLEWHRTPPTPRDRRLP
jgi:hypothetical protein